MVQKKYERQYENYFISEKTLPELSKNDYKILCEKYW
jgi:hypothetical protein